MAKYTLNKNVRVAMQVDGKPVELDLEAGDVDLDDHVARLLVARGIAETAKPKPKKSTQPEPLEQ